MTSIGVGGLALFGSGFGVEYDHRRSEYDLSALDDQHRRANAMIAAGVVLGGIGLALGTTLMIVGVRDRARARGRGDDRRARIWTLPLADHATSPPPIAGTTASRRSTFNAESARRRQPRTSQRVGRDAPAARGSRRARSRRICGDWRPSTR